MNFVIMLYNKTLAEDEMEDLVSLHRQTELANDRIRVSLMFLRNSSVPGFMRDSPVVRQSAR